MFCGISLKLHYSTLSSQNDRNILNKGQTVGVIAMDFSKAFLILNHKLVLIHFNKNHLLWLTATGESFSKYKRIITGVIIQGSISGPLFFNIFVNDLLFLLTNQPDVITPMIIRFIIRSKIQLKQDLSNIFWWIYENFAALNPDKCYFLILKFQDAHIDVYNNICYNKNVSEEKIMGITIRHFKKSLENYLKES